MVLMCVLATGEETCVAGTSGCIEEAELFSTNLLQATYERMPQVRKHNKADLARHDPTAGGMNVPAAGDHVYDPTNMGGATAAGPMEANNNGMIPGNTGATAAGPMEANNNGMIPGNTGTNVPASCPTDTCSPTDYTSCWNSRCASCAHCLAPTNVPAAGDHVYDPTNMGGTNVPAAGAGPMEANNDGMTPGNTGA